MMRCSSTVASSRCPRVGSSARTRPTRPTLRVGDGIRRRAGGPSGRAPSESLRSHASAQGAARTVTARLGVAVSLLQTLLADHADGGERPRLELFRDDDDLYIRCAVRGAVAPLSAARVAQIDARLRSTIDSLAVSHTPDGELVGVIQRSLIHPGPVVV